VRVQASRIRRIQVGDVVIVNHNGTELLKRVQRLRDGEVYVIGDDRAVSTDSRDFGWLPQAAITGKVVWPRR
jgi:type IV secretory pathway protease TraF